MDRKKHWETVYKTKTPQEVSWTQENPTTSINFINKLQLNKNAKIIDIGGGDSQLVDFLLQEGFVNITVLDISENALARAKARLGDLSKKVTWIVSDITEFTPSTTYDVWHDRATFHFLTNEKQISSYINTVNKAVSSHLFIGTFSKKGPEKCSGLTIKQYNQDDLCTAFNSHFKKIKCKEEVHTTPFNTTQNFTFCSFKRREE